MTVTQLTRLIKLVLTDHLPGRIVLEAEVSNCRRPRSGHLYLTLKDSETQLPAVMWRSQVERLKFQPADGLAVVATGHVDVFEPQGKYQFYIDKLEPAGQGALELALRQLTERLRREGLFDPVHKQPLPRFPRTIAIVTSATGAAIRDIARTLRRRWPIARPLLFPVAVQGEAAPGQVARAIADCNAWAEQLGGIDVLLVARGGGSLEDLWAFNEEVVARAIFASRIPIVTGVGHEIDVTVADMVADVRAATPTAAAEAATPVLDDVRYGLAQAGQRLRHTVGRQVTYARGAWRALAARPVFARPLDLVRFRQQLLDEQATRLLRTQVQRCRQGRRRLEAHAGVLRLIEPHAALARARAALFEHEYRLRVVLRERRQALGYRLDGAAVRLIAASPGRAALQQRENLVARAQRLERAQQQHLVRARQSLDSYTRQWASLNPRAVLRRGYSITRRADGGIITAERPPAIGETVTTELADAARFASRVTGPVDQRKDDHGQAE